MIKDIKFYSQNDKYGEFSNFAAFPIVLNKKKWPTSEHYFQAQKFKDISHQEQIRKASSPMLAAQLGHDRKRNCEKIGNRQKLI